MGAIYLACLNLPSDIRYRPENIYLAGIIPGPKEPSLQELNHLLRPLVDELLELWNPGVYLSRTALRRFGRLVRVAIVPLVCDLPAMRKTAGFAGHSSAHFCSYCRLLLKDICNLNRENWPPRMTWKEHHKKATAWRDANQATRSSIFDIWGVRWSELLRLPYWDPTRFAVIDTMHNLLLGELKHHCVEVWGIDIKGKSGRTDDRSAHTPTDQKHFIEEAIGALKARSRSKLRRIRKGYIAAIAQLNRVPVPPKKENKIDYINALLDWVSLCRIYLPYGLVMLKSDSRYNPRTLTSLPSKYHLSLTETRLTFISLLTLWENLAVRL